VARGFTLVSVLAFLVWSLLAMMGLLGLAADFDLRAITTLVLYLIGLSSSVWLGFFSAKRLSASRALLAQLAVLAVGLFTVGGGLLLLSAWFAT
jgi:hypothetical protein